MRGGTQRDIERVRARGKEKSVCAISESESEGVFEFRRRGAKLKLRRCFVAQKCSPPRMYFDKSIEEKEWRV